jgi:hypothetical protein
MLAEGEGREVAVCGGGKHSSSTEVGAGAEFRVGRIHCS